MPTKHYPVSWRPATDYEDMSWYPRENLETALALLPLNVKDSGVREKLLHFASVLLLRLREEQKPSAQQIAAGLESLQNHFRRTIDNLDKLDTASKVAFCNALGRATELKPDESTIDDPVSFPDYIAGSYRLDKFYNELCTFEMATEDAKLLARRVPNRRGGRPRNDAIRRTVRELYDFWVDTTEQKPKMSWNVKRKIKTSPFLNFVEVLTAPVFAKEKLKQCGLEIFVKEVLYPPEQKKPGSRNPG